MYKKTPIVLICLVCFLFTSCATVSIVAPAKQKITLLSETEPADFKTTKKVWYALWGLIPITDNSTASIISQYGLENVKVKTQYDFIDYLIGFFLGTVTIQTKTVIVEGNIAK